MLYFLRKFQLFASCVVDWDWIGLIAARPDDQIRLLHVGQLILDRDRLDEFYPSLAPLNYIGVELLCIASDPCKGVNVAILVPLLIIVSVASQFSLLIILVEDTDFFSEQNYYFSVRGEASIRPIVMFEVPETFAYTGALRSITSLDTYWFSLCLLVDAAVATVGTVLYILPHSEWCSIIHLAGWLIQEHPGAREARVATTYDHDASCWLKFREVLSEGWLLEKLVWADTFVGLVREPGLEVGVDRLYGTISDYDCFWLKIYELVPLFYNLESTLRIIDDRNFSLQNFCDYMTRGQQVDLKSFWFGVEDFTAHSLMHIWQNVIANIVEEEADQSQRYDLFI